MVFRSGKTGAWTLRRPDERTGTTTIDGSDYDFTRGRVFLVRLAGDKVVVRQVDKNLSGLDLRAADFAAEVDRGVAALQTDLKRRDMLKDTLVVFGIEFGRTPMAQGNGRDHHLAGFSVWLAGGGVKGGTSHGSTDDLGYHAVEDKVHVNDLHATMLHLLGLDHQTLTYKFQGRDFRLTDVAGRVVRPILA